MHKNEIRKNKVGTYIIFCICSIALISMFILYTPAIEKKISSALSDKIWDSALFQNNENTHDLSDAFLEKNSNKGKNIIISLDGVSAVVSDYKLASMKRNIIFHDSSPFDTKYSKEFYKTVKNGNTITVTNSKARVATFNTSQVASANELSNCLNASIPKTEEAIMSCKPDLNGNYRTINNIIEIIEATPETNKMIAEELQHL